MSKSAEMTTRFGSIKNWLYQLDRILRGEVTRLTDLQQADIKIPVLGITLVVIVLAVIYGFCMGVFGIATGIESGKLQGALMQTFASMSKVPLLFFLTLIVTFPSLYVFNALVGSQLRIGSVLKLLIASLAVNLSVLASMGPILAFFSLSTPSYSFIVLLNVVVFGVAGVLGLTFLIQTLNRLTVSRHVQPEIVSPETDSPIAAEPIETAGEKPKLETVVPVSPLPQPTPQPGPLDRLQGIAMGKHGKKVFACWIIVFSLVGAQMGWVLRPFIGSPDLPFQWFRPRGSNFFEAVGNTLYSLFF